MRKDSSGGGFQSRVERGPEVFKQHIIAPGVVPGSCANKRYTPHPLLVCGLVENLRIRRAPGKTARGAGVLGKLILQCSSGTYAGGNRVSLHVQINRIHSPCLCKYGMFLLIKLFTFFCMKYIVLSSLVVLYRSFAGNIRTRIIAFALAKRFASNLMKFRSK